MKKKLMILLFSIIAVSAMTSCGNDNTATETLSTRTETMEYKTMEPPDDGWTIEELLGVTYLCGTQLSYPMTLESLGEEFSVDTTYSFESDYGVSIYLLYEGQMLTAVGYNSINKISDFTEKLPIDLFSINQTVEHENPIVLNGISLGATLEEVRSAIGEPDEDYENKLVFKYGFKEDENIELTLSFESNQLYSVRFTCLNGKV